MSIVALIPARAGSARLEGKNLRDFAGHPLIAYAIRSALNSWIFDEVYVSTEDMRTADVAMSYGAKVIRRPREYATSTSPDIDWVRHALEEIPSIAQFMIVRATSPFRTADTLRRAWGAWVDAQYWDRPPTSLRAVQRVKEHPRKMWKRLPGKELTISPYAPNGGHDEPTQTLGEVYVQNGCLHIGTREIVEWFDEYTGYKVLPFFTVGYEGVDINDEEDFTRALFLVMTNCARPERMVEDAPVQGRNDN